MNSKQARERLKVLNNYNFSQPKQHLTYTEEKRLKDERLVKRKIAQEQANERVSKQEKKIWLNSLKKRIPVSELTESIMIAEEEYGESFYNK